MKLPVGIYAVSADFENRTGDASFTFQDVEYEVQIGINAFENMDLLVAQPLVAATAPFWGYVGRPVVLVGAGTLPMDHGVTRQERFRTTFPCAAVILGENAGINPNGGDLRTPAIRRPESVLQGTFYFGAIAIDGDTPGTLTVDGITLGCKIQDQRTGGEAARLEVKNTVITAPLVYTLMQVWPDFQGKRTTLVQNCRADGLEDRAGEGNIFRFDSGDVLIENLYVANTAKFLGMNTFAQGGVNAVDALTLKNCLFENSCSTRGLTLRLPENSTAKITLENCVFDHFTPENDPAVTLFLPETAGFTAKNCTFAGNHPVPAILIAGSMAGVTLENTLQTGYSALCAEKPPRRTQAQPDRVYPVEDRHMPMENGDFSQLDTLYAGRTPFYGDFHCHSNSGGTSDGKTPIEEYVAGMQEKQLDFAAIVDHWQMRHFFLPCWDPKYLICGTEPGALFKDVDKPYYANKFDYTMIFPDKTGLMQVMERFPEFNFTGTPENGSFDLCGMPKKLFFEIADYVYSIGGLLSHAHPRQLIYSDEPLDYYFGDHVPLETVHVAPDNYATYQNRALWLKLLKLGKRVRTHGSSDSHGPVSNRGLTAVYAQKHYSTDIFNVIRSGDCTAGGVAIQMCIGDTPMGGVAAYAPGKTLLLRVAQFHPAHAKDDTVFCLKLYTEKGLAYAREFDCSQVQELAFPVEKRMYYRLEITNESDGCLVALSNPIWVEETHES